MPANQRDEALVKAYLKEHLPANAWQQTGFYEKLYLYQSLSGMLLFCRTLLYYRYAQKMGGYIWRRTTDDTGGNRPLY